MDPATILQLVEGLLSLALQCGHAINTLCDITAKYKYAKLTIVSMVQGLDTMQLAWSQIGGWSQRYVPETAGDGEVFLQRLQKSLENGTIIMDALEGNLKPYQTNNMSFMQRSEAIWNENTLRGHQDRISHQAMAMTCLLQVIQLKSSLARTRLIDEAEPVLRRLDQSACSIVLSRACTFSSYSFLFGGKLGPRSTFQERKSLSLRDFFLSFFLSFFLKNVGERPNLDRKEVLLLSNFISFLGFDTQKERR